MRLHSVRPISSCGAGLAGVARRAFDQDALHRAHAAGADAAHVRSMRACNCCRRCSLTACGVSSCSRRPACRAGAEDEAEAAVEAHVVDQLHQAVEVVLGLAREADDEVAGQADARAARRAACGRCSCIPSRCSRASSPSGCGRCRAAPAGAGGSPAWVDAAVGVDQPLRELVGVAGGVADALDAGDLGHVLQQQREVGDLGTCWPMRRGRR
jgi:hypothetical protein